ncbi:nicotinate-nucleotide adenylyltransferase [Ancylomarina subtilis]|uniref:Probable nicotinate-nucleotide adenylyltransferase n=1 Tax=Ancylomarina subtilis TaxID=1639035 RepID=A0A4Q7V9L1_9BACT|nr:nicotinate (nicotinamide) nucleotide adenylyltransferase [Ancylomarina subtilis]RZT93451.1 nicotinate-nucleotide adenylyltransferase [Ancylomarina subtilis]
MKIGLFFGSFNPIHIGHLAIANFMAEYTDLEEIWFIVSPHNPLKNKASLLNDYHRLELVKLSIEAYPQFKASNIEFGLPQPSFTIDTLSYLKEKHSNHQFSLIVGSDNLNSFTKWKNYELLLQNHELYVYPRPGFKDEDVNLPGIIHIVPAPLMEVSSSFIRQAIKEKKEIPFFLPAPAYQYIKEMHFYEK